ncbi:amidohydrolase [bacterium]|nr:amidohydrolase [bacterium]
MYNADILIKNGIVLTMDTDNRVIETGSVAIKGDSIIHIGDSLKKFKSNTVIDAAGGIILPGLINGHTHAAMTLLRGLADDLPLMEWLNNYIFPTESRFNPDFVYTGTLLACAEMIMSGTTSFCDMYLFEGDAARAAKAAGMRCLLGEVLYDFDSPNYGPVENGLKYTESLIEKWKGDPLVSIAVEPHAPYTCSPHLLSAANELAQEKNVPMIMHLAETENELLEIKKKYGKGILEHLSSLDILGPNLIADHCVHLDGKDLDLLSEKGVRIIHNPESNMKLASGIAPVPDMLHRGIKVGLGTDGCASNNDLDLFSEMDSAAKLHKVDRMDTTVLNALSVLRMATIEGAKALGIDSITGSLEKGKKADIIILDINKPHLVPMYNPYSHIVYSARGSDVSHTIINGKVVMSDRKLLVMDVDEVMAKSRSRSREIIGFLLS